MSCPKATGPVNIIPTQTSCFNKCRFSYNFTKTGVNTSHKSDYISIEPSDKNSPNVIYSSANTPTCMNGGEGNYAVEEIRIYHPSIHRYGKKKVRADAELIIHLNNVSGGKNLIVCIPITNKNGSQPGASDQLKQIINYLSRMGNSTGEGGTVQGLNFDLNTFIPQKKGFYAYTASLPYPPCSKCIDYIVYDVNDAAISLDNSTLSKVKSLIAASYIPVQANSQKLGYAYNKRGAQYGLGNNDAIWIDCQPTGSNGQILMDENKEGILSNNSFSMFSGMSHDKYEKWKHIVVVLSLVLAAVLVLVIFIYVIPGMIFGTGKGGSGVGIELSSVKKK
jgi:carbonic anhydrase